MIVVDLGCCPHQGDQSIQPLIHRYKPDILYGFDPGIPIHHDPALTPITRIGGTQCVLIGCAAWTYSGTTLLGTGAQGRLYDTIIPDMNTRCEWTRTTEVPCFDFAKWLNDITDNLNDDIVVKMNVEGAEFTLLEHVLNHDADRNVIEWLVQWHDDTLPASYAKRRHAIEVAVGCPIRPWGPAEILNVA